MKLKHALMAIAFSGIAQTSVVAQTVNEYNYKRYAFCTESVINGKVYSTFGEGHCPPESRRTINSNDLRMKAVRAIGDMQQSLLVAYQARVQRNQQEARNIVNTYFVDVLNSDVSLDQSKYLSTLRIYPDIGSIAFAEVGSALIYEQAGFYAECFASREDHERSSYGWVHVIKSNQSSCKFSSSDELFTPLYYNYRKDNDPLDDKYIFKQSLERKGETFTICIKYDGIKGKCIKDIAKVDIQLFSGFVGTRGFERGLVFYQGVKDGLIRFSYRLPNTGDADPANEVSIDPAESRNVTIGNIHFEIVEWNDTVIAVKMK